MQVVKGTAPCMVQFTDQSTGDITNWLWDFGDGQTSTEQHPIHVYQNIGIYDIRLTVSNPEDSSSILESGALEVYPPTVPSFFWQVRSYLLAMYYRLRTTR